MRAFDLTLRQASSGQGKNMPVTGQGRFLVLDTETTGLGRGHRVVEIGVVELINRRPTGREFHAYINPERSVDPGAERVHGLSNRFLNDKPKFAEVFQLLVDFLGTDGELVAHHASFDIDMLDAECERLKTSYRLSKQFNIIDTMKLSRKLYPGQRSTLDANCDRLGVSRAEREKHGALIDARIAARVFLAMTAGQVHFGYSEARQAIAAPGAKLDRTKFGPLRVVVATAEEAASHSRLCDAIERSSGGYCGFRGKWTKPETPALAKTSVLQVAEFGSGTIEASCRADATIPGTVAAVSSSPSAGQAVVISKLASAKIDTDFNFSPSI